MPEIQGDQKLIRRLQAGDVEALGDLYDRYRHQIYRTALAITHDPNAADDILQECFLRVYRYANRIDPALPLAPWLYRVTVNLSYTWTKRNRRNAVSLDGVIDYLTSAPSAAPEPSAEQAELLQKIQEAIDALPFEQRAVIVLHYLNGLSVKEIAEVLECPVGTVKSRLHHARRKLRKQLGHPGWVSELAHGYT
ncbi:MAG TPA: RNA polymerase sigma factor [Chloroflexi bacterium]|nr:RNA polymerase sigma factor [Chloroflexota bacterium]